MWHHVIFSGKIRIGIIYDPKKTALYITILYMRQLYLIFYLILKRGIIFVKLTKIINEFISKNWSKKQQFFEKVNYQPTLLLMNAILEYKGNQKLLNNR